MINAAQRSSKGDAVRDGLADAAVSLTPAALRVLWTLYKLDQHGERWVHVVEIARVVHLPVESVHRLMTQIRPRKNLRRNTEHPRQWGISESGRGVCRTVESIARELGARVPILQEERPHARSRSSR